MTKKQRDLLNFIRGFTEEYGYSPSFEEMATSLGVKSKAAVHRLISSLEEQGLVRRLRRRARAIEIVEDARLPTQLHEFSVEELAAEAKRRSLVLGHIFISRSDSGNGVVTERRTFKEIKA